MDRPAPATVLHRPIDVAQMLGCSEWWVREQARKRRIPYSWIGGSYRFTDGHVTEIVRLLRGPPGGQSATGSAPPPKDGAKRR